MITEDKVMEFLDMLPKHSWLKAYVNYAKTKTTSPAAYHIVCGLGCISACTPSNVGLLHAGASPIRANFFGVLVGRSGDDQKSTATGIARRVIREAQPHRLQPNPVSPEGLKESLAEQPRQTLVYSEFGDFLTQTKQGYGEGLKTTITDLWDCTVVTRRKAKKDENIEVRDPRLSILAACALPFLTEHTTSTDWSGGFFARWFFIHAQRERVDSFPARGKKTNEGQILAGELAKKTDGAHYFCGEIEREAFELWDQWFKSISCRKLPKIIAGLRSRIPTHALRVLILLAVDLGYTRTHSWNIDTLLISLAIEITEMYVSSLQSISESLEPDEESRVRRRILEYLKDNNGFGSLGEFIREYRYPVAISKMGIDWLACAGYIQKFTVSQSTRDAEKDDIIMKLI